MSKVSKPICYGDIIYIQCDNLFLMANGQYSPILNLNSTENIALKSFRNGLFMLYPNLTYKDITQVEQLEHQLDLLKSLNPEEVYAAQQLEEDIKNEKLILEEREAKLVALNDKMFEESKGQPIKYHQKVQLLHIESQSFVGLSNQFDKSDKSMNYLELTKEGSKNLYFEFVPKLAIQEREIVDYDTPISLVSSKSQSGLKLGEEINKETIKTIVNPLTNKLTNGDGEFIAVPPRRLEPIYQTDKLYVVGMSEVIGTETLKVKKYLSYHDQVKGESKKLLKNGDYIRIAANKYLLYCVPRKDPGAVFFQAFSNTQEYKFHNTHTVFQIIDVSDGRSNMEGNREKFDPNILPEGHFLESQENNRFVLKNLITGEFATWQNDALVMAKITDFAKLYKVSLTISGRSEADQLNNYIDKNAVLQMKCYNETGEDLGSFQCGESIKVPNVANEVNLFLFFGFYNPDNYLNKFVRPERFKASVAKDADITNSSFKFLAVSDEELCSIQLAEGFAYEAHRYVDFLFDFKEKEVDNLKEFNQYLLRFANLCKRYNEDMYEGEYNEAIEDILIPNNLRQTLLRELRTSGVLYQILQYLVEDPEFKKKFEATMKKGTDEGKAQATPAPATEAKKEEEKPVIENNKPAVEEKKEEAVFEVKKDETVAEDKDKEAVVENKDQAVIVEEKKEENTKVKDQAVVEEVNKEKAENEENKDQPKEENPAVEGEKKDEAVGENKDKVDSEEKKPENVVEENKDQQPAVEVENKEKPGVQDNKEKSSIEEKKEEKPVDNVEEEKKVIKEEGKADEIVMENKETKQPEPVKGGFNVSAFVVDTNEKAVVDELREINYVNFELLIRRIVKLLIDSFKKNDYNRLYCNQWVRVPINCFINDKTSIGSFLPNKERKQNKSYMIELAKQGLWDKDVDALQQLNYYEEELFKSVESQETFHPYYLQILQHISNSKAPNLFNSIRDNMVLNFLSKEINMKHLFPRLYEEDGKMYFEFIRMKHEGINKKICLDDQVCGGSPKAGDHQDSEKVEEFQTLLKYLQESLALIFGLDKVDSSLFKIKIMRYYTYQNLTKAIDILKTSSRFRELRALMSDLVTTIHQNYLSIPFVKLPKQLQILDQDPTNQAKISRINTFISDSVTTGVTQSERTYLKDEDAEDIIQTVISIMDLGDQSSEAMKIIQANPNIDDLESSRIMLEEIKKSLGSHVEVKFDFLKRSRHVIISLINQAMEKEGKVYTDFIKQALEVFHEMDTKTVAYAATEITSELKQKYLAAAGSQDISPTKKRHRKILSQDNFPSSSKLDTSGLNLNGVDEENQRLMAKKVAPAEVNPKERSTKHNLSNDIVAASTLAALARKWKTGERFLLHVKESSSQATAKNPLIIEGEEKKQVSNMQESLQTSKTYNMLLNIFLLKQPHLLSDAIHQLRKLSAFESNLYRELDKLTILQDFESLKKVEDIVQITFRLNEISREINFCKDILTEISEEKMKGFLDEAYEGHWKLFFILYDTSKHFRYPDDSFESTDKRFRETFEKYKKVRWDKLLTLVPEAVNPSFQKIFNILKTHLALFTTQYWILDKKTEFGEKFMVHQNIFRVNIQLLFAFVVNNKENQNFFANNRVFIRQYYHQHFMDQSCDALTVFAEIFRSNRKLLKLPHKYLYDITLSSYVTTINRVMSNTETNSYLAGAISSFSYLGRAQIPIELYNALTDLRTKFLQIVNIENFAKLKIQDVTEDIVESPYCYYSIRSFLLSFLEIHEHFASDGKSVKELQSILKLEEWLRFFIHSHYIFQYELKNLVAKCFIENYFKTFAKGSPIIQDSSECLKFVASLLADILFFRKAMTKKQNQNSTELTRITETPSFIITHESYLKVNELQKECSNINLETKKLEIFLENISLERLMTEYIYEGCFDLLFNLLLKFPKFSSEIIDSRNDAKSMIAFVLEVLDELIEFEGDSDNFPFKKVENFLSKASSFKEYSRSRANIIKITNKLYVKLKAKGKSLDKKISLKNKPSDAHQTYKSYITPLYNFKRESKEQNIKQVAEHIAEHPEAKNIIAEILAYLKRDINKLDHEEIVFILRLLRKYIEIENTNNPDEDPIYMWKEVNYVDLKKIERVQDSYRNLGLSPLLYTLFSINDPRIFRETLLLSLAYMYGGNTEVQRDFYENFKSDDENRVIRQIREKLEAYWTTFKRREQKRVDHLYSAAHKTLFEYFSGKKSENDVNLDELQHAVSGMNLKSKITQLAEREPVNEQFLLILTFLQCLCERQFTGMQNFLREQKVNNRAFTKSFDVLNFLRHGMNSYYKVLNRYNLSIGNKVLDLIIELIQGEVHENITVLLHKTFVHDLCRILTDYNSRYHTLPRGFGLNIFHENFREFKSKIIFIFKTMLENRNDDNIKILAEHLDIRGLMNTFLSLMTDFATKNNLHKKNQLNHPIYILS